jgi:CRP-like cAMP-binding protein
MDKQLSRNLVRYTKGTYIILEDKRVSDLFYVIQEGKIHLSIELLVSFKEKRGELNPGDFFGMISTMSGHSQIETAQALTDVVLLPVRYDQFDQFIQENPQMVEKILLEFSKQMRFLNEILAGISLKRRAVLNTTHLYHVGEYYRSQKQYAAAFYAYQKYIKYCPTGDYGLTVQSRLKEISSFVKKEMQYTKANDLTRIYPKNTMIFSEGEPGEEVFFIRHGKVKITKVVDNSELLLAVLTSGDIFGEMALLESKLRGASAIAYEESQLMVVDHASFKHLIKTQPAIITRLTTLLAQRTWIVYKKVANTQIDNPLGRMIDTLFIQLEKKRVNVNAKEEFIFDFGPNELINTIGLSQNEGEKVVQKLLKNRYIDIIRDKIAINDMFEFYKQANYFRTMR